MSLAAPATCPEFDWNPNQTNIGTHLLRHTLVMGAAAVVIATGFTAVGVKHRKPLGADKRNNRDHIKNDLLGAAQRLAQHHKHLSAEELRELDEIVDQLARVHTDADACLRLRRKYSDLPAPPWALATRLVGTRRLVAQTHPLPQEAAPLPMGSLTVNRRSPCRPTASRAHSLHGA